MWVWTEKPSSTQIVRVLKHDEVVFSRIVCECMCCGSQCQAESQLHTRTWIQHGFNSVTPHKPFPA